MPGQGTRSMLTVGVNFGVWLGLLAALALPHTRGRLEIWETCPRHGGLSKNARRLWSTTAAYRVPRGSAWPGRVSNSHETSERCESRSAGDRSTARWSVCGVTHPLMRRWSRCGQARHDAVPASCRRAASAPPEAGARHERTLLAVGSNDLLGAYDTDIIRIFRRLSRVH